MHTSALLAARPDVHPHKPPRRRMRQTHANEEIGVDRVVQGAEVLMRERVAFDSISSVVWGRRIKLQYDRGSPPFDLDPIAATRLWTNVVCGPPLHVTCLVQICWQLIQPPSRGCAHLLVCDTD